MNLMLMDPLILPNGFNFGEYNEKITLNNLGNLPGGTYFIHYNLNDKPFNIKVLKK